MGQNSDMTKITCLSIFVLVFSVLVESKTLISEPNEFQNSKDIVWFPSSDGDGKLIPAKLRPSSADGNLRLGDISDVHFYLYTRATPNDTDKEELVLDNLGSIDNSHFINEAPVKFLVHGFGSSFRSGFPSKLKNEFMKLDQDLNIILMDWEPLSASPDYFLAFENAQIVSAHAAQFIDFMVNEEKVTRQNVHLIGYSLGGQVVGQIGSRMADKVARITALDPALPLFDYTTDYNRTDPSDAVFVDVMHVAANGFLAYRDPSGHVDWYPNGGGYQPGCGIDASGFCAHGRAPDMYTESLLTTNPFYGRECDTYDNFLEGACDTGKVAIMGEHTPTDTRGVYYLQTNSVPPYSLGPFTN